jgi:hypothetical protein
LQFSSPILNGEVGAEAAIYGSPKPEQSILEQKQEFECGIRII